MTEMFYNCSKITSLDLSNFNTENVENMRYMFDYCSSLSSLNISNFNTENVTDMHGMFGACQNISSLDLSNFNTKNVTNMGWMFKDCLRLTNLNISNFDMKHLLDFEEYGQSHSGKEDMCANLSTISTLCTITCTEATKTELQTGTNLPTNGVTFTWVTPASK